MNKKKIIIAGFMAALLSLSGCSDKSDSENSDSDVFTLNGSYQITTEDAGAVSVFDRTVSNPDNTDPFAEVTEAGGYDSRPKFSSYPITIGNLEINFPGDADEVIKKFEKTGGNVIISTNYDGKEIYHETVEPGKVSYIGVYYGNSSNGVTESPAYLIGLINKTDKEIQAEDASVCGLALMIKRGDEYYDENPDFYLPEVSLPGGITFHSTFDDIVSAYGRPYGIIDHDRETYTESILYYNLTENVEGRFFLDDKGVYAMEIFMTDEYDCEGSAHTQPNLEVYGRIHFDD